MTILLRNFCLTAVFFVCSISGAIAERVALVIGNSEYSNVPSLLNPKNDAEDIATSLENLEFKVERGFDLDKAGMLLALQDFQERSLGADIAVIYYAGHGIEISRNNYLIPVDANLESDRSVRFEAVALDDLVFSAEGAATLSLVIVDACRNNPFVNNMNMSDPTRSISRGLTLVEPQGNTLVAYAARAGTTAADGSMRNSPYAHALIGALNEPGLELGLLFRRVRDRVLTATENRQEPWVYGTLSENLIYLHPASLSEPVQDNFAMEPDFARWATIRDNGMESDFRSFIDEFPNSDLLAAANARLASFESTILTTVPDERSVVGETPLVRAEIRELQERLNVLGLSAGFADGIAGRRTSQAVERFQLSQGLEESGDVSSQILQLLRAEISVSELEEYRAVQRRRAAVRQAAAQSAQTVEPQIQEEPQSRSFFDLFKGSGTGDSTTSARDRHDRGDSGGSDSGGGGGWN